MERMDLTEEPEVEPARKILIESLLAPIRLISENAGYEPSVVSNKVKEGEDSFGFNAKTGEYVDMVEAGIIDPAKVTITAISNAVSIAGIMLTTSCIIVDKK